MREILPDALPGRRLEDCTAAELVQLGMRRYAERAIHESHLAGGYISDGSSLHEWVYGTVRVTAGINPNEVVDPDLPLSSESIFFADVMDNIGSVVKQHAVRAYEVFVHLPVEFPLVADGHRPVSEAFRATSDQLLLDTLAELGIPNHIIGGSIPERLNKIVDTLGLDTVRPVGEAIDLATAEVAQMNIADELAREAVSA